MIENFITTLFGGAVKRKSVKRKSVKRKSVKRKSVKRKSVKRKSVKRKSVKRTSNKKKSEKRKSLRHKYTSGTRSKKRLLISFSDNTNINDNRNALLKALSSVRRKHGLPNRILSRHMNKFVTELDKKYLSEVRAAVGKKITVKEVNEKELR